MARKTVALVATSPQLAHAAWLSMRRIGETRIVMLGPKAALASASSMRVESLPRPSLVSDGALREATAADVVMPCDERSHVRLLDGGIEVVGHNDAALVRRLTDKGALPDIARQAGFATPPLLPGTPDAPGRYLEKPQHGGGGEGIREWSFGMERIPGSILQPFIEGQDIDVSLAAIDGEPIASTAEQKVGSGLRRYFHHAEVERAAHDLVRSTNYTGLMHIDLRLDAAGKPWVIDINPRIWASHWMAASMGMDFAAHFVNTSMGGATQWQRKTGVFAAPWRFGQARVHGSPSARAVVAASRAWMADPGWLRERFRLRGTPAYGPLEWPQAL